MDNTGLKDIDGKDICAGDKMSNIRSKGNTTYEVKLHKNAWWLFDGNNPYAMLIPRFNSNQVAQYKVVS